MASMACACVGGVNVYLQYKVRIFHIKECPPCEMTRATPALGMRGCVRCR